MAKILIGMALALIVSACASDPKAVDVAVETRNVDDVKNHPFGQYPPSGNLQCVPFARQVSGIQIYGDAHSWWPQAQNKYSTGTKPQVGAVLVLRAGTLLRLGHVAVVVAQQDSRNILVSHANWGSSADTRGTIHERQPAQDVSPNNDWSQVRFMNLEGTYGKTYPAHGFIYRPDNGLQTARN